MPTAFVFQISSCFGGRTWITDYVFVARANVAELLFYKSSPEGATTYVAPKDGVNATAIL